MIKAILFDFGEVIFTNDWHYDCPEKFEAYSHYFDITYDQMEKGWNEAWPMYEVGKISEEMFWNIFLTQAGAKKIDLEKAKSLWRKYFSSKPKMFSLLKALKKHYILAVLSSTGKEWLEYKIEKYKLDSYFTAYITTCNTGYQKTDNNMYFVVLDSLKLNAEEILLIDDSQAVLTIAQQTGIQTILFENAQKLLVQLKEKHILI